MQIFRKQIVRFTLKGKRATSKTTGAKRHVEQSNKFYGTITANGKRKQVPLTVDRDTSLVMLKRLTRDADVQRANGTPQHVIESRKPLDDLVAAYKTFLASKGGTTDHVEKTITRIERITKTIRATRIVDVDAPRVSSALSRWREASKRPMSVTTSNHYARAIKGLTRWLSQEQKTERDVLSNLRLLNAKSGTKRERRALVPKQIQDLINTTEKSGKRLYGLSPVDRAMLYRVAVFTGLRASELASLRPSSFDLVAKTVTVEAAYSKRRRRDVLPLHNDLIRCLVVWSQSFMLSNDDKQLWRGRWTGDGDGNTNASRMIAKDYKRAGIPLVDERGRHVDFHALRHTFITSLARNGVHPSKAKELARHSTITLTMDVYSHVTTDELRESVNAIPSC